MKTVAVLTPAYNRCDLLDRLYASLKAQTDKDFIWVVIDDGSTDGTEEYFSSLEKNSDFQIVYHKKENGGKHKRLTKIRILKKCCRSKRLYIIFIVLQFLQHQISRLPRN